MTTTDPLANTLRLLREARAANYTAAMALADPPDDAGPEWGELWGLQCDLVSELDQAIKHFTAKRRRIMTDRFNDFLAASSH